MVQLCRNRPEGFGPHSNLHPRLPTTCFLDVIVEPLSTWVFLLIMASLLPIRIRNRHAHMPQAFKPDEAAADGRQAYYKSGPRLLTRTLSTIYYLLTIALLALMSLEIARLSVADLGIGLLPFSYVGVLTALANRITWRARIARCANVAYWTMLAVVLALKTAAEQEEQMGPAIRIKDQGVQGMYPTSDEALDNAVMVGVTVVLAALEFVKWKELPSK